MSQRLDAALRELRRGVAAVPDAGSDAARRERIAGRVTQLQRDLVRADRTRRRFTGILLAAAAAVSGLVLVVRAANEPSVASVTMTPDHMRVNVTGGRVSLQDDSGVTSIDHGDFDVPGDAVVATDGDSAALRLSSRAGLALSRASRVKLSARPSSRGGREERVRLLAGRVDLDVPKLGDLQELAVETPDAVVEVRGTRFSVSLVKREPLAAFTEVDVTEGSVRIRMKDGVREVAAGQSWRSIPDSPAPALQAQSVATPPEKVLPSTTPSEPRMKAPAQKSAEPVRSEPTPSELAAQNRLLDAAELAKENKMPALALERLERLIANYPDADLAHNARVERFRLLAEMGRADDARAAARDYLARHPRGFARGEAQSLVGAR